MSEEIGFIPPKISPEAEEYWRGARQGKLMYQKCRVCGAIQFPFLTLCRNCLSEEIEALESSGRGQVITFSTIYRAPSPAFVANVPYTVALVELEEGYRMLSALFDTPPESVSMNMKVKACFRPFDAEHALPLFQAT
jgi:uncharacterized OB-fold protein